MKPYVKTVLEVGDVRRLCVSEAQSFPALGKVAKCVPTQKSNITLEVYVPEWRCAGCGLSRPGIPLTLELNSSSSGSPRGPYPDLPPGALVADRCDLPKEWRGFTLVDGSLKVYCGEYCASVIAQALGDAIVSAHEFLRRVPRDRR